MGFCGCDSKRSALIAGVFSSIQSVIAILISSVILSIFKDEKMTMVQILYDEIDTLKTVLAVGMTIQVAWLLSSLLLIYGNRKRKSYLIRMWLVVTTIALIGQVLFPVIILAKTMGSLQDRGYVTQTIISRGSFITRINTRTDFLPNVLNNYICLVLTFSEGGLIALIINIVLCFYTGRRAANILNKQGARYEIGLPPLPPENQVVYRDEELSETTQQPQPTYQGQGQMYSETQPLLNKT